MVSFKQSHLPGFLLSCSAVFFLCTGSVIAHDQPPGKKPKPAQHGWSGKAKVGFDSNVGNTNTSKITVSASAIHNKDFNAEQPFRHTLALTMKKGDVAREKGGERQDTVDKEMANYRIDYYLNDRSSVRAFGFHFRDKQAKIEGLTQAGVGYEYDVIKTPRHTVNLGGGINFLDLEYTDGTPGIDGVAGRIALNYDGQLTDNISLNQRVAYLGMEDFTLKSSNTSVEYSFTQNASVSLDHEITNYSRIAQTAKENTDSSTSLNLNFKF